MTFQTCSFWGSGARPLWFCIALSLDVDCPKRQTAGRVTPQRGLITELPAVFPATVDKSCPPGGVCYSLHARRLFFFFLLLCFSPLIGGSHRPTWLAESLYSHAVSHGYSISDLFCFNLFLWAALAVASIFLAAYLSSLVWVQERLVCLDGENVTSSDS